MDVTNRVCGALEAAEVRWVSLRELDGPLELSCIDGRHPHGFVGAPGGNAGELVLLLAVAEEQLGRAFEAADVEALLDDFLDRNGRFYLHSDRDALDRLGARLRATGDADCAPGDDEVEAFVRRPPAPCRSEALELLVQPDYIGCGHLQAMRAEPAAYGVRGELVDDVLRVLYRRLWEGHPAVSFVLLEGRHAEEAVVVVDGADPSAPTDPVPVFETAADAPSVFLLHRPAAIHLRRASTRWLADAVARTESARGKAPDPAALFRGVEGLGSRQLAATVERLAADLPRVDVVVDPARRTWRCAQNL